MSQRQGGLLIRVGKLSRISGESRARDLHISRDSVLILSVYPGHRKVDKNSIFQLSNSFRYSEKGVKENLLTLYLNRRFTKSNPF